MHFIAIFNGTTTYDHAMIEANETLHIDACLNAVGGICESKVYFAKLPKPLTNLH